MAGLWESWIDAESWLEEGEVGQHKAIEDDFLVKTTQEKPCSIDVQLDIKY